jgi:Putative peptidoglycan binding domain
VIGGSLKGFLGFCIVVVTIGLLGLALPYLKGRDKDYEQRFVGALNFTEGTIENSLDLRAGLYEPSIAPGTKKGYWNVSGILVSKDDLGNSTSAPIVAVLQSVCSNPAATSCWRLVQLAIDGKTVETLHPGTPVRQTVAEGANFSGNAVEFSPEQDSGFAPSVLIGGGAAGAPAETFEATPEMAVQPIEAAAPAAPASPALATPASSQLSAVPDIADDSASPAPADAAVPMADLTRLIQDALKRLDYEPGPTDGKLGPQTAKAIRTYQQDFHLDPDGRPSIELLGHLRQHLSEIGQQSREPVHDVDQPSG